MLELTSLQLEPDHFFWARDHLANARQYAVDHDDTSIVEVIDVALKFIEQYWPDNKIADGLRDGVVEFKDIWSIYPPNALIVGRRYLDDLRVYRVKSHHYYKTCKGEVFRRIKVEYYDFDGKVIGAAGDTLLIPEYTGALAITSLAFFPLNVSPNRDNIWDSLIARSKHQFDLFKKPFQVVEHEGSGAIQFRNAWEEWVEPQKFKVWRQSLVKDDRLTSPVLGAHHGRPSAYDQDCAGHADSQDRAHDWRQDFPGQQRLCHWQGKSCTAAVVPMLKQAVV